MISVAALLLALTPSGAIASGAIGLLLVARVGDVDGGPKPLEPVENP